MAKSGIPESTTRAPKSDQDEDSDLSNDNSHTGTPPSSLLTKLRAKAATKKPEEMSVNDWLERCKTDKGAYADFSDRLTHAIGEPDEVNTKLSDKQERIVFGGRKVLRYEPFSKLYDQEGVISNIATYIRNGGTGILVLRGPVGSGKTEIAGILERLAEQEPMYLLRCKTTGEISPFNDTPLCLVSDPAVAEEVSEEYNIPQRYLKEVKSPWVTKRLEHHNYDESSAFDVVKIFPSREKQLGIAKLDPKDNQSPDINALIGEKDFNKIGEEDPLDPDKTLSAGDPDAYIPGAFSKSHGGVFHGAEFFRNNPAMLNTFLEPVTEGYFTGDSGVGMLPMNQLIVLTTNDPVWQAVLKAADSDALHNRSYVVDVGYTLRMSEEMKIYSKLLQKNGLDEKPIAPETLDLLAEFAVVTRLKDGVDGALAVYEPHIRARVHNGEIPDGAEKKIPKIHELKEKASPEEGLEGFSIRDAQRVMQGCFNARANEGIEEADTLLMIETLRGFIKGADDKTIPSADKPKYEELLSGIAARNKEKIQKVVNAALIDADDGNCQVQFDKYLTYAQAFVDEETITEGGEEINMGAIKKYLEGMEKRAGITQPEEFRQSVVSGVNRELARIARANAGKAPEDQEPALVKWNTYEPLAKVIRAQHETDLESRRHIIKAKSDSDLRTDEEKRQYTRFYENMHEQGYTDTMVNRMLLELV
ncbi:MAG: hypothetical protein JKY71_01445 [Alphaproteobacteria bacterium]|nr:hypothetical protein [Alphaproteobacteria bacterium]